MNPPSPTKTSRFNAPLRPIEKDRGRFAKLAIAVGALLIGLFGATRVATFLGGPALTVEYPLDGSLVHEAIIKVLGHATNIASLAVNGHPVYTDSYGYFDEPLLVPPGYSILEVTAKDRFGRTETKQIRVIYK